MAGQEQTWWTVRMVIELIYKDPAHTKFEDRIILVRAANEEEARAKGARLLPITRRRRSG